MSSIFVHMQAPEESAGSLTQESQGLAIRMAVANGRLEKGMDASCDILGGNSTDRQSATRRLMDLYDADCGAVHRGRFATHADIRLRDVALFRSNPLIDAVIEQRSWIDRFFVEYECGGAFLRLDLPEHVPFHMQGQVLQTLQGMARISDPHAKAFIRHWYPSAPGTPSFRDFNAADPMLV